MAEHHVAKADVRSLFACRSSGASLVYGMFKRSFAFVVGEGRDCIRSGGLAIRRSCGCLGECSECGVAIRRSCGAPLV
jgi:hypothetical protein